MKHSANSKAGTAAVLLLLLGLSCLLAACGRQAGSQVAGADQQVIYGYLLEVNDQARTVTVDPVELIAAANIQRLNQLGLDTARPDGQRSYVYNPRRNYVMYPLERTADFDFNDRDGGEGALSGGSNGSMNGNGSNSMNSSSESMSEGSDQGGSLGAANLSGNGQGGLADGNGSAANSLGEAIDEAADEAQGTGAFDQPGNSVSGNTTVGDGTATVPDGSDGSPAPAPVYGEGYGYLGVEGGLFDRISSGYDRINAYMTRYDDLLCRLVIENGAVTGITVCTKDNM